MVDRDETILRWARAIWQAEVAAGNCSSPEPVTPEVKYALIRAASAAYAVLGENPVWPGETGTKRIFEFTSGGVTTYPFGAH